MLRRLTWLVVGAGFGFGMAVWLSRFLREIAERYSPESVAGRAVDSVSDAGATLREALSEGRVAMREREVELRAELESPADARRAWRET